MSLNKGNKKTTVPPIIFVFKLLQQQSEVTIWLYEQTSTKIQGIIKGFDEFMNIVLDEASEISLKSGKKDSLGRILLKGENISLISSIYL